MSTMVVLNILSTPSTSPSLKNRKSSWDLSCFSYANDNLIWTKYGPLCNMSKAKLVRTAKSKLDATYCQMQNPSSTSEAHGSSWLQDNSSSLCSVTQNGRKHGPVHSVLPSKTAEVSSVEYLYDFICEGPLIAKTGLTPEKVADSIDKWLTYGSYICRLFQLNDLYLTEPQKVRIYHYYVPVFLWCEQEISRHASKFVDGEEVPPLVIGFSAPQGCGKTTLVFALEYLFGITGRKCATLSIDDFYLTAEDQVKLRESNPGNALLEYRGNAGSHDLPFSVEALTAVTQLTKEGMKLKLPRYDKSAYNGRGDRGDPSTWPEVEGPLTVVLFEGWMLGFKPVPSEVVKAVDPQLEIINKNLESYYDAWEKFVKSWIVIKIKDPSYVYQWRLQAEIAMRNDGKPGMSDEERSWILFHDTYRRTRLISLHYMQRGQVVQIQTISFLLILMKEEILSSLDRLRLSCLCFGDVNPLSPGTELLASASYLAFVNFSRVDKKISERRVFVTKIRMLD